MEQIFIAVNDTECVFWREDERRRFRTDKSNFHRLMDDVFINEIVTYLDNCHLILHVLLSCCRVNAEKIYKNPHQNPHGHEK